jgi:hypothetical protein
VRRALKRFSPGAGRSLRIAMDKSRVEAFSDGVIAIAIT